MCLSGGRNDPSNRLQGEGVMSSILSSKIYTFVWRNDSSRVATITFDATAPDGNMTFTGCNFKGVSCVYSLDDWDFLSALADEIKMLCKKEGVTV